MTHGDQHSIDLRERYVGYATHCLELAKVAIKNLARSSRRWLRSG
jgi:hypothetical protein